MDDKIQNGTLVMAIGNEAPQPSIVEQRLQILETASQLGNVTAACRKLGVSRSSFYKLKRIFSEQGVLGLNPRPRRQPRMPNAFPPSTVSQILEMTSTYPNESYLGIAARLIQQGVKVSGSGVRKVWRRAGLTDRSSRLKWIEGFKVAA